MLEKCIGSVYAAGISWSDSTLADETCPDRLAVPYLCTVVSHSHREEPSLNSSSSEEDFYVLVPTKTYSTKSMISLTKGPIPIQTDTSLPSVISPDQQKPILFQRRHLLSPWLCQ